VVIAQKSLLPAFLPVSLAQSGLRLPQLQNSPIEMIAENLRKQGVPEDVISAAIAEAQLTPA